MYLLTDQGTVAGMVAVVMHQLLAEVTGGSISVWEDKVP